MTVHENPLEPFRGVSPKPASQVKTKLMKLRKVASKTVSPVKPKLVKQAEPVKKNLQACALLKQKYLNASCIIA